MSDRSSRKRSLWSLLPFALDVVVVEGDSMTPTFARGDWLLVRRFTPHHDPQRIRVGDILLIEREEQPGAILIKRLREIRGDSPNRHFKSYWVEGDNEYSQDSRSWGALTGHEIVGKVLRRIKRAA